MSKNKINTERPTEKEMCELSDCYYRLVVHNIRSFFNREDFSSDVLDMIEDIALAELVKLRDGYHPEVGMTFKTYTYLRMVIGLFTEAKQIVWEEENGQKPCFPKEYDEYLEEYKKLKALKRMLKIGRDSNR